METPLPTATPPPPPPPSVVFRSDDSLGEFSVSMREYLAAHPEFDLIATGALVFHTTPDGKVHLLVQKRSAHDSMPGRWETPGGGCDPEDESILHGVVRELWEESGLVAEEVAAQVGPVHVFFTRRGMRVGKFNFEVKVRVGGGGSAVAFPEVRLDPEEHDAFVWATEEECRAGRKGDLLLKFTTKGQEDAIWEGFRRKRDVPQGLQQPELTRGPMEEEAVAGSSLGSQAEL